MGTGASTVSSDLVALVLVHRQPGCKVLCINITCSDYTVGVVCFALWEVPTHRSEYELRAISAVEFVRASHQHCRFCGTVKLLTLYNGSWRRCKFARYDAF
jgi:hypothetical protein